MPRCAKTIRMLLSVWILFTQDSSMARTVRQWQDLKLSALIQGNNSLAAGHGMIRDMPAAQSGIPGSTRSIAR